MVNNDIELQKMFIEARHNKNLVFANIAQNLTQVIKENSKEFPQNSMDLVNNRLSMFYPQKKQTITVDSNRIIVDIDQPAGVDTFYSVSYNAITNIVNILKIDNFIRIGVRAFWGINVKDAIETNKKIVKKFVKLDNEELDIFGTNLRNFHFGFTTTYDKYKINYNFIPGSVQNINITQNGTNIYVKNYIMADIDFYIDSIVQSDEIISFIRKACNESQKRAKKYFDLIGGKINGNWR